MTTSNQKMPTQNKILKTYGLNNRHILFTGTNFVVFSDDTTDMIMRGRCEKQKTALYSGQTLISIEKKDCDALWSRIEELSISRANSSFTLSSLVIQKLKKSISNLNATHIRFYNDESKLKIVVFDYIKFHSEYRLPRKVSQTVRYHETLINVMSDFSVSLLASSFTRLPTEELNFRIGENGITQVTVEKSETSYLLRNQKLIEPMTVFHSSQVGRNICFVFAPKSNLLTASTNQ